MRDFTLYESLHPDVIVKMLKMAFSFENWDKLSEISNVLCICVHRIYEEQQEGVPRKYVYLERPLVYYYGFGLLMRGLALLKQGKYEQSGECVSKYTDLSWMTPLDEEGYQIVEDFRFYAKANRYALDILSGRDERMDEYVHFLRENPEEVLPGLNNILQSAFLHNLDVDHILHVFAEEIGRFGDYEDSVNVAYYYTYSYFLAVYLIKKGKYRESVDYIIQSLSLSHKLHNDREFKQCIALFETYRDFASDVQIDEYKVFQKFILEGAVNNEKMVEFMDAGVNYHLCGND
ncbi:DNA-binding protein [Paenibacillus sp. FSL K6-2524]|uniref:DNA-binding protein n=1 Tax=Paenibacillus sp. FSL K6-2524 TaxID=2954516 RepID=UPI0030FB04C4